MAVRKRGKRWWYDFTINHIRYRGPIPTARTKRKALEEEDKVRTQVYEGTWKKPSPMTIGEFVEQVFKPWAEDNYKNPKGSQRSSTNNVVAFFASTALRDISPMMIERFKRERLQTPTRMKTKHRKPATVNRDLVQLSKILSMARDNGFIRENPCSRVKLLRVDNARKRYLTEAEEEILLKGCIGPFSRLRPVIVFALNTGMRRGEITSLRWADIDLVRGIMSVRQTKTNRDRIVPINARILELLKEMGAGTHNPDERLFNISRQVVSDSFYRLTDRLKLVDLHFHDLRHTFATRLGDAGEDPFTIAELLGHTNIHQTREYTHALTRNLRRAVEALDKQSSGAEVLPMASGE